MKILQVCELSKAFGGNQAVDRVDLVVEKGEVLGIIGPNGSGKTTLCNCIMGILRPDQGKVLLNGVDVTGMPPYKIARHGLRKTFQLVQLFPNMTVFESLLLGLQETSAGGRLLWRLQGHNHNEIRMAEETLEFLGIQGLRNQLTDTLSYGQQKLLEFGVALIGNPSLLILDEPAGGVNPTMLQHLWEKILEVHKQGCTFIIIEHNMPFVMGLCNRITVLNHGKKIFEGVPDEIKHNSEVIEVYLGA